jgi:hypothetical protein
VKRPKGTEENCSELLNGLAGYRFGPLAASERARPPSERALAIREKVLGAEHPDTAMSLNNLAELLRSQGDYAGARPLYDSTTSLACLILRATMMGRGRSSSGRWRSTRRCWEPSIP